MSVFTEEQRAELEGLVESTIDDRDDYVAAIRKVRFQLGPLLKFLSSPKAKKLIVASDVPKFKKLFGRASVALADVEDELEGY